MLTAIACATAWDGVEQITLAVTSSNHAAVGLYQSVGFVQVGRIPRALRVDGLYYDELNMVRMINRA